MTFYNTNSDVCRAWRQLYYAVSHTSTRLQDYVAGLEDSEKLEL